METKNLDFLMEMPLYKLMKESVAKLRKCRLENLEVPELDELLLVLEDRLGLDNRNQVLLFVPVFDRSCADQKTDASTIAAFYDCNTIDTLEMMAETKALTEKGVIRELVVEARNARYFMATTYVTSCILSNRKPEDDTTKKLRSKKYNQYDLCQEASKIIHNTHATADIFRYVQGLEDEHPDLVFIALLRLLLPELSDRILFYEICKDFLCSEETIRVSFCSSNINATLSDLYDSISLRMDEQSRLQDGTHALLRERLCEITYDRTSIVLTEDGEKFLLGKDFNDFNRLRQSDKYAFVNDISYYVQKKLKSQKVHPVLFFHKMSHIEHVNLHLDFITELKKILPESRLRVLFYLACHAKVQDENISLSRELNLLFEDSEYKRHLQAFKDGEHKMQKLDLVDIEKVTTLFSEETCLELSEKGMELFFGEDIQLYPKIGKGKDYIASTDIPGKNLFFEPDLQRQLSTVEDALQEENYQHLMERLEEKHLAKGMAILLYGEPGTGKTETAMQWARATGRGIMHVDISASKSMWYGESEKIVKEIFTRYKKVCRKSQVKPILLFNEADAIFSKRKDITGSRGVAQTENTIQNIILEEMEKLDGILIATTNLQENLDKAFERRFLFKIKFTRPTEQAKQMIWRDKMAGLSGEDAALLASRYNFSGGEIDNIVRKAEMMEVLQGKGPTMDQVLRLCNEERIGSAPGRLGFVMKH